MTMMNAFCPETVSDARETAPLAAEAAVVVVVVADGYPDNSYSPPTSIHILVSIYRFGGALLQTINACMNSWPRCGEKTNLDKPGFGCALW